MTPYILLMLLPCLLGLFTDRRGNPWIVIGVALIFFAFVGLRYEVGPDWTGYLYQLDVFKGEPWFKAFTSEEAGFKLVLWAANETGGGIYLLNIASAAVFCAGLFYFARSTGAVWIAIAAATSYLVLAMGMSAIRQAMAMGLIFIVFANWTTWGIWRKALLIGFASLFHFSALLMLPFLVIGSRGFTGSRLFGGAVVVGAAAVFVLGPSDQLAAYSERYVGEGLSAQATGAIFQALLNAIPATIYLIFRRHWQRLLGNDTLLFVMALASLAMLPLYFVSSVGVSRMSMYLTISSMIIWATMPRAMGGESVNAFWTACILGVQMLVMLAWLGFANVSEAYFPYQNILFR